MVLSNAPASKPRRRARPHARASRCAGRASKLSVHAQRKHRYRPALGVVGRIADVLIVKGQLREGKHGEFIVSLEDFFRTRRGKLAVANENAETPAFK